MFGDFLNGRLPIKSQADKTQNGGYVEFGYGQVEPNHLSAQRTGQIYAQLPANPDIDILEQGQFVKYDYAANANGIGEVNFTGEGEWMLVYNEIKLYRNHLDGTKQWDCEFAMIKDDYQARVYTPYDWEMPEVEYHNGLYLNGTDEFGKTSRTITQTVTLNQDKATIDIAGTRYAVTASAPDANGVVTYTLNYNGTNYTSTTGEFENVPVVYAYDDVTKDVIDIYEQNFTNDPWRKLGLYKEKMMRPGTTMVPRVFKTNIGDIFTTNMVKEATLAIGDVLAPNANGILVKDNAQDMKWQVVKLYTMPDGQQGVKVMRIA
ncbi:MAG: hypothetical protein LIR50_14790 [Bacillota bacterium]|nr:hypothetical protein [Bacillota bacterium]